jgi:glutathione S-transferase
MVLNYMRIPYRESFISYPDIEPFYRSFGKNTEPFTLPAIIHSRSSSSTAPRPADTADLNSPPTQQHHHHPILRDSFPIATYLDRTFSGPDHPTIFPSGRPAYVLSKSVQVIVSSCVLEGRTLILPKIASILDPRGREYFIRTRSQMFGRPLDQVYPPTKDQQEAVWKKMEKKLLDLIRVLKPPPSTGPDRPSFASHQEDNDDEGPFFLGSTPSYADIIVVSFLTWWARGNPPLFDRMCALGDGELGRLWDGAKGWVEGAGEVVEWDVGGGDGEQTVGMVKAGL